MKMCADRIRRMRAAGTAMLAVVCLSAACGTDGGKAPPPGGGGAVPGEQERGATVLRVEGGEFTNEDFFAHVKSAVGEDAESLPPAALSRLFDKYVDEKILLAAARRQNVTLTDEEKRGYLAKLSLTAAEDVSPELESEASGRFFDRLTVEKYAMQVLQGIEVSRAEIRKYYNDHKKEFLLAERIQVSQILYGTEQKAVAALRRLEKASSPDEFRRTAREESLGPEAVREGLMGVYKPGDLPSDMEKVIFALDEGKLSRVVESSYGYHIFRVDKKLPPHLQAEEEAAPAIRLKVLDAKYKETLASHLEELKNALAWQAFHEKLIFPYQRIDG